MLGVNPVFTIPSDYENSDKIIEDEDTIDANQFIFFYGNVIINGTFIIIGQMTII